jgi:hypothetical protein
MIYCKIFLFLTHFFNYFLYFLQNFVNQEIIIKKGEKQEFTLDNKLLVGFVTNFYKGNLKLNNQIISVNNQKVTTENICEMQTLLNTTQNWDTLQLEVLPAKSE